MAKARSLNKVILIGNLTRDPVLRETSNGVLVCTFGVATNSSWKDSNGEVQERAEFHNIVAFNKLAEICAQVLAVGMYVYIEGELRTRVKTDANGNKVYRTEVKLNDMLLLDAKEKQGVGIEAAREAGKSLPAREGDDEVALDDANNEQSSDEDFNEEELF
ncbi:MAG: single-stranded DNA-binding protein 1 [Candidatus Dojkabacteria bacterium]|nr:MAG: single-stranded DNA-binding protein 1 [Candidatus Dojkabacteria bacterium]